MIKLKTIAASAAALALMASSAMAADKVLRIQSVLPTSADEVVMLKEFGKDVAALTNGSLTIEVLPAGAVVGPRDIIDAVDAGLVEGGFAGHTIGLASTLRLTCSARLLRVPV